jgi:hypothetical protein
VALEAAHEASEAGISIVGANHREPIIPAATKDAPIVAMPDIIARQMPRYVRAIFPVGNAVEPHDADPTLLTQLAIRIIEAEGPIHVEEVSRRIAASFGRGRAGARIFAATRAALDRAVSICPDLLTQESFWFTRRQLGGPQVRDRVVEEGSTLKASNISLLEIRAAIQIAREDNAGCEDEELIRTVARLLGFRRVGSELQARLAQGLETPWIPTYVTHIDIGDLPVERNNKPGAFESVACNAVVPAQNGIANGSMSIVGSNCLHYGTLHSMPPWWHSMTIEAAPENWTGSKGRDSPWNGRLPEVRHGTRKKPSPEFSIFMVTLDVMIPVTACMGFFLSIEFFMLLGLKWCP